jgi:hypothetical protein
LALISPAYRIFPINRFPRQPFLVQRTQKARPEAITNDASPQRPVRVSTWSPVILQENIEATGVNGEPLSRAVTEPELGQSSSVFRWEDLRDSKTQREKKSSSQETTTERHGTRPSTSEETARRRFLRKFLKNKSHEFHDVKEADSSQERHRFSEQLSEEPFTVRNQLEATILGSWINLLLITVPAGFALYYTNANPIAVFFVNFVAIIPMSGLLGGAMDELRVRTGDVVGALVYMSFGYVVQYLSCLQGVSLREDANIAILFRQ